MQRLGRLELGASLVEVVVAMAVLTIAVAGAIGIYGTITKASVHALDASVISDAVRTKMAELEAQLAASGSLSEDTGEFEGTLAGWMWRAAVEEIEPERSAKLMRLTLDVMKPSGEGHVSGGATEDTAVSMESYVYRPQPRAS